MAKKVKNTISHQDRLRLSVFRSNRYLYAQIIDDTRGRTLVAASDLQGDKGSIHQTKSERAKALGASLATLAKAKKIRRVYLDRGRNRYHGRIQIFADSARATGLEF